ncbi:MAG: tetratricopeptide repeat protein [Deltaproteobacteria bacterium]|jgi:Tfp pilus assembly protein PilF|nr:tetratricopeptide repeat protein [Deltaproteobacteria bacterium]
MPLKTCLALLIAASLAWVSGCGGGARGTRNPQEASAAHIQAVINVGLVAIRTGDFAKALQSLQEADRLSPNNPDVKHHLGRTYYQLNNTERAIALYEEALALDSSKTDVHNNLGLAYMSLKDYDKARAEFQICIDDLTYSNANMSRFNMGLLEEAQDHPDKAAEFYHQIIAYSGQTPASAPAYYRLAYLDYKQEKYREAVDFLTAAVRQNQEFADAYFLLGECYEKLSMEDEAAEAYGRCVVIDPSSIRGVEAQRRVRNIMRDYVGRQ